MVLKGTGTASLRSASQSPTSRLEKGTGYFLAQIGTGFAGRRATVATSSAQAVGRKVRRHRSPWS